MKLLLTVCLAFALLYKAESLSCYVCGNADCSNATSVTCNGTSTVCQTVTSVRTRGSSFSYTVTKNCSSLFVCATPLNTEVEWSLNRGYARDSYTQICCGTDDCNFQTLAIPNVLPNGKECPACASSNDSIAGTCNTTLPCMGVEDSCFNGTTTSNSTEVLQLGCISRNLCSLQPAIEAILDTSGMVTCGAPWSVRVSVILLPFALTAHKVFV